MSFLGGSLIKVMHIINSLESGGAEMTLARLVKNMDKTQFSNVVVSLRAEGFYGPIIRAEGITLYTLDQKTGIPSLSTLHRLYQIIKLERPDILQTWLYLSDVLGLIMAKMTCVPVVFWNIRCSDPHRGQFSLWRKTLHKCLAVLSRFPTGAVANSKAGIEYHSQLGYRPKSWEFIPNGFDTETLKPNPEKRNEWRTKLKITDDIIVIGLLARYDRLKDIPTFIQAASLLAKSMSNVQFCLVGTGMSQQNHELYDLLKNAEVTKLFHLVDRQKDIAGILSAFDIFSLSSISEGFPNVTAEAMACELPTIVTDVGDSLLIVGNTGMVVPPRSPEALAAAWAKVAALSPIDRSIMGQRARQRIVTSFPITKMSTQYESIYKRAKSDHL
jgi:glycosyltransferase involved in cell wall biosynthesis